MKATVLIYSALGLLALSAATPHTAAAQTLRLAVVGDSISDEYRANDNRGGAYAATTLNWVELLQRYRPVDVGAYGTRPEPRRSGYEFNFARSSAVSAAAPAQAQGVAGYVAAGQVNCVVQMIGANDFNLWNNTYQAYYNGLSASARQSRIEAIVQAQAQSMDILQNAGLECFVVVTVPDISSTPRVLRTYTDAAKRQRVTSAVEDVNAGIRAAAALRGVRVVDINDVNVALFGYMTADGSVRIAGERIDLVTASDEPHSLTLADAQHLGTVVNGLLANVLTGALGEQGYATAPFTATELVRHAGIQAPVIAALFPTAYRVLTGSRTAGGLGSLDADDGDLLQVRSTTSGTQREAVTELTWQNVVAGDLTVVLRLRSGTSGSTLQVEAYDAAEHDWDQLLDEGLGTSETDRTITLQPEHHAAGIVVVRVHSSKPSTTTVQYIELARVDVR
jgi:phospholipase/lecithinase/hemolysin